jgi:glutathione S-transferase
MSIILYGMPMSPYVRKALAFANEKGLLLESRDQRVNWPKGTFESDFLMCSPFGKVPALRDGEFTLSDSSAIIAYLDALHPEPNLIPIEPRARAKTVWFDEFADTIAAPPVSKIFANRVFLPRFIGQAGDEAIAEKTEREELTPILNYLELLVPPSGYLVEDRFTLADLAVVSALANLRHHDFSLSQWPKVADFFHSTLARPSFSQGRAREEAVFR